MMPLPIHTSLHLTRTNSITEEIDQEPSFLTR